MKKSLLLFSVLFLLFSCSKDDASIVGTWRWASFDSKYFNPGCELVNKTQTLGTSKADSQYTEIQFTSDNKYTQTDYSLGSVERTVSGTYSISGDKIKFVSNGDPTDATFSVSSTDLTIFTPYEAYCNNSNGGTDTFNYDNVSRLKRL